MSLIPYRKQSTWLDSFAEMENIQKQMNQLFDFSLSRNLFGDNTLLGGEWAPAVDIYDSKDNILIKADLPGLTKDEVEKGLHHQVVDSLRWLAEWCLRLIKMFGNKVAYRRI